MLYSGRRRKDRLFNFRPVFFTAASLCAGVVFSYLRITKGISAWWLLLLLGLFAPLVFCGKARFYKSAIIACTFIFAFLLGANAFSAQVRNYTDCTHYNGTYFVAGRITEKAVGTHSARLQLTDISVNKKAEKGKLIAYLPSSFCENLEISDEVLLHGKLRTEVSLFDEYGFRASAIRDGIKFRLTDVDACAVTGEKWDLFAAIRNRAEKVLYRGMDVDPASVTLAVLTGNTAGIEDGLLENMRYGGIAHVFAVSGLHVGALFAFCMYLVTKTPLKGMPKPARFVLVGCLLVFYGGICGFSASVLRAVTLCLVGYAAKLIGTAVDRLEVLGVAAILVLLISPVELLGVGFQLSFLACLGIFLWRQPIEKWINALCEGCSVHISKRRLKQSRENQAELPKIAQGSLKKKEEVGKVSAVLLERGRKGFISLLSVSLAAQIGTFPVLLSSFGYVSVWSIFLNLVFIPFISATFSLLLLFAAVGCVLPLSVAPILLYLPNAVFSAALLLFEAFDFSNFVIRNVRLATSAFVCYYGGMSFVTDKWNLTTGQKQACWSIFIIALTAILLVLNT